MDSTTAIALELENFEADYKRLLKQSFSKGVDLRVEDFLYLSAINRTIDIANGFSHALAAQNLSVLAVLIRVQINTLATLNYLETSERRGDILRAFNQGVEFRRMAIPGKKEKLIEKVLIDKAKETYAWIAAAYSSTSSWVHLSPTSTYSLLEIGDDDVVTLRTPRVLDEKYQPAVEELCECMAACLRGILNHIRVWASSPRS